MAARKTHRRDRRLIVPVDPGMLAQWRAGNRLRIDDRVFVVTEVRPGVLVVRRSFWTVLRDWGVWLSD